MGPQLKNHYHQISPPRNGALHLKPDMSAIVLPFRPDLLIGNPEGKQFGVTGDDYPCADNGNDCRFKIFAASVPGVTPSRSIT